MNPDKLNEFYARFGVTLTRVNSDELNGECPFCTSTKLFVRAKDEVSGSRTKQCGMYSCKVCGSEGNIYTFLKQVIAESDSLPAQDLINLSSNRGFPKSTIQKFGFVYWHATNDIFLPVKNQQGSVVNLLKLDRKSYKLFGCSGLPSNLFGLDRFSGNKKVPLWLLEGQWDYMAWSMVLDAIGLDDEYLAVPGSNVMRPEWLGLFAGRTVNILFDNDHIRHEFSCDSCRSKKFISKSSPLIVSETKKVDCTCGGKMFRGERTIQPAKDGISKILNMFSGMTKKPNVNVLEWPDGYDDGYDMRDLVVSEIKAV